MPTHNHSFLNTPYSNKPPTVSQTHTQTPWRALSVLSFYRLAMSICLLLLGHSSLFFTQTLHPLFIHYGILYFSLNSLFFGWSLLPKHFTLQVYLHVVINIAFLSTLVHLSGGIESGLGMLIAIDTMSAAILLKTPKSLWVSVFACIFVVFESLMIHPFNLHPIQHWTHLGLLSILFLASGLIGYYLSKKIKEGEKKVEASIRGLENMAQLNEMIIEQLHMGIIVVDKQEKVYLFNQSAWHYLGMPIAGQYYDLKTISPQLSEQLHAWKQQKTFTHVFKNALSEPSLMVNFSSIGEHKDGTLIFIDDASILNQKAQHLKLASLGRLTASIAHEIRNPLGALSHAAQLMDEMLEIDQINHEKNGMKTLIHIIENNASRMNKIIENIMQLSSQKKSMTTQIPLSKYLLHFKSDYLKRVSKKTNIDLHIESDHILISFDETQLTQILNNLVDNALRYSLLHKNRALVQITCAFEPSSQAAFLDVIDIGEGIAPEIAEKIFEPFFTTSQSGSGLGLYLSRELCEANKARLDYLPLTTQGACFRIRFFAYKTVHSSKTEQTKNAPLIPKEPNKSAATH
jgi:two-component system sensor histidine kinase PilS (NtrC family)